MSALFDALSWALLIAGSSFCLLGGVGLLRFRDFYSRIHAASMTDSLGAPLILLGLMVQAGVSLVSIKLLTVWVFLWLTSPASSHALAKAAYAAGIKVELGPKEPTVAAINNEALPASEGPVKS